MKTDNRRRQLLLHWPRSGDSSAWFECITTGAQTLTIDTFTVTAPTTIDWGDGSQNTYTGSGARTHAYAGAGTYKVRILQPLNVTHLALFDTKIRLHSANIRSFNNIVEARFQYLRADSSFYTSHISHWRPKRFWFGNVGAGFPGLLNTADMSEWRPNELQVFATSMSFIFNSSDISDWRPNYCMVYNVSGLSGTFSNLDVADWRPTTFRLYDIPSAYSTSITSGGFSGWGGKLGSFQMHSAYLTTTEVDAILADLYAAFPTRTVSGGTINVGGTNQAPSGTLVAACPPTTGKEYAYELANDSCGINPTRKWTTVTITT